MTMTRGQLDAYFRSRGAEGSGQVGQPLNGMDADRANNQLKKIVDTTNSISWGPEISPCTRPLCNSRDKLEQCHQLGDGTGPACIGLGAPGYDEAKVLRAAVPRPIPPGPEGSKGK